MLISSIVEASTGNIEKKNWLISCLIIYIKTVSNTIPVNSIFQIEVDKMYRVSITTFFYKKKKKKRTKYLLGTGDLKFFRKIIKIWHLT